MYIHVVCIFLGFFIKIHPHEVTLPPVARSQSLGKHPLRSYVPKGDAPCGSECPTQDWPTAMFLTQLNLGYMFPLYMIPSITPYVPIK